MLMSEVPLYRHMKALPTKTESFESVRFLEFPT